MLYPIIDVGSNTVKLAVLDEEKLFNAAPVFFKAVPLCLGASLVDNAMPREAVDRLCALIREFKAISARLTAIPPIAFATASLRGVLNREEVCGEVARETGVSLEIISGEDEAYYSFLGALGNRTNQAGVTVDLGGGSTEILAFRDASVQSSVSLPIGCLSLYNEFFSDGKNGMPACRDKIRELLRDAPALPGNAILISGGSAKALLSYKNLLETKNNMRLSRRQMERVLWHFEHGSDEDHERIKGILRERFRLVPPAVAVFTEILAFYGKTEAFVCRSGVREGRLKAFLAEKSRKV
ncbi:MAG: hypothetical protein J6Z79_07425 [Clostridia bacterium]|nr:hypothetical protein [Clostridia bacterium]